MIAAASARRVEAWNSPSALMIFARDAWFYVGVATVVLGVLFIGASLVASRHLRQRGWDGRNRPPRPL